MNTTYYVIISTSVEDYPLIVATVEPYQVSGKPLPFWLYLDSNFETFWNLELCWIMTLPIFCLDPTGLKRFSTLWTVCKAMQTWINTPVHSKIGHAKSAICF